MRAGRLRRRLQVLNPGVITDINQVPPPVPAGYIAAEITPGSSSESVQLQAPTSTITHTITTRWTDKISTRSRLSDGRRTFHVVSVIDVGDRRRELAIGAVEKVGT